MGNQHRRVSCFSGIVALALLLSSHAAAQVAVGDAAPPLSFRAVDGSQVDLAALRGKLVLIDFWATWCGPCMAEADHMVAVNEKYKDKGLVLLGISLDQDRNALLQVVKEKNFKWPQQFDGLGWDNKFAKAWGVKGIPRTFLIDTEGKVAWVGHPARMDEPIETQMTKTPPVLVDPAVVQAASTVLD